MDAGKKFSREYLNTQVPLLSEVLEWAQDKIDLVIEIKGNPFPSFGIEKMIIEEVEKYNMNDHVIIISFYHESVKIIKEHSNLLTGILYTGHPIDPVEMARNANADSIRCDWKYLKSEDVISAHKAGLWVSCWGADTIELFEKVTNIGVDSIGCNYPDLLYNWLRERGLGIN